jgi:cytochrome c-type biogenesis protein CcmH
MSPLPLSVRRLARRAALTGTLLACLLSAAPPAPAFTFQDFPFEDPAQEQAFRTLTGKLRCLVCQNESLAASQSDLAQDLRREVYHMMRSGKSEAEITRFLVERYGDFVLYEPPVKPSTWFLWFGPFLLVALGGLALVHALRRQGREPDQALSPTETARIEQLLADGKPEQAPK